MGFWDAIGKAVETWGAGELSSAEGPDWREQLHEREAVRRRAAAGESRAQSAEERREASEKITLADQLAKHVAEAMEAEQGPGDAGQMDVGGYTMNLPTAPPPDYRGMLPEDLVSRTGMDADAIMGAARGKRPLSRRQLELLKGANRLGVESTRQRGRESLQTERLGAAAERQESGEIAAMERLLKRLGFSRDENEKYRNPAGAVTPDKARDRYEEHHRDLADIEKEREVLTERWEELQNKKKLKTISDKDYAREAEAIKNEDAQLTRQRTLTSPKYPAGYPRSSPDELMPATPRTGLRLPEPSHRAPGAGAASAAPEAGTAPESGTNVPETGTSGLPQPRTQEEYDALPSGALFLAPDGSRRRKP